MGHAHWTPRRDATLQGRSQSIQLRRHPRSRNDSIGSTINMTEALLVSRGRRSERNVQRTFHPWNLLERSSLKQLLPQVSRRDREQTSWRQRAPSDRLIIRRCRLCLRWHRSIEGITTLDLSTYFDIVVGTSEILAIASTRSIPT